MAQCVAKTNEGLPCQIPAREGEKYCHIHRKLIVRRLIFSSLGLGTLILGIFSFVANLTGILGYFGLNSPTLQDKLEDGLSPSPYKNAYIYLVAATPAKEMVLNGGDDIEYNYKANYYIPTFDWATLGYQPQIIIEICTESDSYGNKQWILMNSFKGETTNEGDEKSVEFKGKFIVPNNDSECQAKLSLRFKNLITQVSRNYQSQTLVLPYKVSKTNYKNAFLQFISAEAYNTEHLIPGDEVKIKFTVNYFVSDIEVQRNGYKPLIKIGQALSTNEYGYTTYFNLLQEPAEIGSEVIKDFTVYAKVPEKDQVTIKIGLETHPNVTPSNQLYEYILPFQR